MYVGFLPALLPVIVDRLGLSYQGAGLVVSVVILTSQLSQPAFGIAGDRLGRRWLAVGGPLLTTVSMSWLGVVNSYELLLVVLILGSLGTAAHHPAGAALVSAVAERRDSVAMAVFTAGGSVGFGLGAYVVAALAVRLGTEGTLLTMPIGLAAVTFLAIAVPRSVERTGRSGEGGAGRPNRRWWARLTTLYLVVMLRAAAATMFTTFVPILLRRRGESLVLGGSMVLWFTLAGAVGGVLGSRAAERIGRRAVTVAGLAISAPALYLFLHTDGLLRVALLLVCGACIFSALPLNIVMAQRLAPRHASTVSGLVMGFAWGIGGLSTTGLGALADHWAASMGAVAGLARAMDLMPLVPLAAAAVACALPRASARASEQRGPG